MKSKHRPAARPASAATHRAPSSRTRPARRATSATVGRRGTVVIPAELRRMLGMDEGSMILLEQRDGGIWIRPAEVVPVEVYDDARKAEFLLNGATSAQSYKWALGEVRRMGLDPEKIPHLKPGRD